MWLWPHSAWLCFLASCLPAGSFYLPGVTPRQYLDEERVGLKVNALTSTRTQLPFGYYTLPFCTPKDGVKSVVENLGEILAGDEIENSPYELKMRKNETCKVLCQPVPVDTQQKELLNRRIDRDYHVNWIVDNLPAQTKYSVKETSRTIYMNGFPVGGRTSDGYYYVHNHVSMILMYHKPDDQDGYRIVGFEVAPFSLVQTVREPAPGQIEAGCGGRDDVKWMTHQHENILYTYDVTWVESTIKWASRWDHYLEMEGGNIHWFSILNSLLILVFLSAFVALILIRALHRDIARYNELVTAEEVAEDAGWKLVHADVFRKPAFSKLLAASVGSGTQLLCMTVITLVFALRGALSPAHRGGLLQSGLLMFTFMGLAAGYASARLYKFFQGENWKETTMLTALLFPGTVFGIFFFLNLLIWGQKSAGSVPFATMFAILVLWFGISVPLVFLGAYLGYKKPALEVPVRTSQMPREIPSQPWYSRPLYVCLIGGVAPFVAVFTELFFIMSSLWLHHVYYLFGILALVVVILVVTCAEISIAFTYFQLTGEDYHWWWRSFLTAGSSGLYVFLYSWYYFVTQLQIDKVVSTLLYFGYMAIVSMCFVLVTGTIGLVSAFCFVRKIYGSIKVD